MIHAPTHPSPWKVVVVAVLGAAFGVAVAYVFVVPVVDAAGAWMTVQLHGDAQ